MDGIAGRPMTREQALDFTRLMISEVATRPAVRGRRSSSPLIGKHSSRTVQAGFFRGSDLHEHVCVCFFCADRSGIQQQDCS